MARETEEMEMSWWGRNWMLVATLMSMVAVFLTIIGFGLAGTFSVPAGEQHAEMTPEQTAAYSAMLDELNATGAGSILTTNTGSRYLVITVYNGANFLAVDDGGAELYFYPENLARYIVEVCSPDDPCYAEASEAFARQFAD